MSNSKLVDFIEISPNKNSPRNHKIDTITIHCVVGQCSVEALGHLFASPKRQGSSNYGIGYDGRIGLYVDENDRSWCSSNGPNDHRAITIEVASDTKHPYKVTDVAYNSLIELCADICKRNNIKELKWKADKTLIGQIDKQNMTVHRWFANKACPGDYLYSHHYDIARKVNEKLGIKSTEEKTDLKEPHPLQESFKVGEKIKLIDDATYITGQKIPKWVLNSNVLYIIQIRNNGDILFSSTKRGAVIGVIHPSQIKKNKTIEDKQPSSPIQKNFFIRTTMNNLKIYKNPDYDSPITGTIVNKGVYTIVEVKNQWGKLKSGIGWIPLQDTKKIN